MKDIDTSIHRLPQNLEAEQSILGGILLDNHALNSVLEILTHKDFYSEAHRKVFAAIVSLSDRNEPCDLITLSSILKDRNSWTAWGRGLPCLTGRQRPVRGKYCSLFQNC